MLQPETMESLKRNAVAIMAGEKQIRGRCFDFGHQLAVTAIADVVLRNRLWIKGAMPECRLALHPEQHAQILAA